MEMDRCSQDAGVEAHPARLGADRCQQSSVGIVVINAKNVIDHERFWKRSPPFAGVEEAIEALRVELRALADLGAVNRSEAEWDALFAGKALMVWLTWLWPSLLGAALRNHAHAIAAIDLFVVPTLTFERLFAFLVLGHGRRQLLWFEVTRHPTDQDSRRPKATRTQG
jgi:hypothetical protein